MPTCCSCFPFLKAHKKRPTSTNIVDCTKILDVYDMDKKRLGEGAYGSVCKARNKSTQAIRAVKSIAKDSLKAVKEKDRLDQEIALMKMMDHPNILRLYENFEDHRCVYLVMELASGGELFDKIIELSHFTETQAAILMEQIVRAVFYMHSIHICHRDLKPENFLFMHKEQSIDKNILKIIDFGLSCKFSSSSVMKTKAGTPYYVAQEVLSGKYDELSDLWSVGVIMYVMLCGYPPFYGETDREVLSKVRVGAFSFDQQDWKGISQDAKALIRNLLAFNPRKRYTAEQALADEWIKKKAPRAQGVSLHSSFIDNLRGFRSAHKLKKAALQIIAGNLQDEQVRSLRQAFIAMDKNSDGFLTQAEVKEGLKTSGFKKIPADLQQLLESVDADGSGKIDYTEFLAASLERRVYLKKDACWAAFRVFDRNGDGQISMEELKMVLKDDNMQSVATAQHLQQMMSEVDLNGNGSIDFEEFMQMMQLTSA